MKRSKKKKGVVLTSCVRTVHSNTVWNRGTTGNHSMSLHYHAIIF